MLSWHSDTHGLTDRLGEPIPDGDVLLHAGDFTNTGKLADIVKFSEFLKTLPHRHKIVIAVRASVILLRVLEVPSDTPLHPPGF